MEEIIVSKLDEIEEKENIRIIYACESGSRAWGFASPDSDFDVRFIYVRSRDFYLKLEKTKDVIDWQLDEIFDISGWDLNKALRLLHSSNPTLFEWSNSPVVYKTTSDWAKIDKEINNYFSVKSGLYHYLSMARGNYKECIKGETVKLKKYLYVIRPLLACKWILNKKSPPPMLFSELVEAELDTNMKPVINALLKQKMEKPEIADGKRIDELNNYIESNLNSLKAAIEVASNERRNGWDKLNELFVSVLKI